MRRRRILRAAGTALATAGLAGCLATGSSGTAPTDTTGEDGGTPESGDGTPSPTPGETTGSPASPEATSDSPSSPETTVDSPAPPDATTDATPGRPASRQPDPDLPVTVENDHDAAHTVELTVSRDGTTVHEATHDLSPGADREVYNLREADPDGIETFTVAATLGDRTGSATVETSGCYGSVVVVVQKDGELFVTYSIC